MKTTIQIITLALSLTLVPHLAFAKLEEGTAAYERKDFPAAFQELLPVAKAGDARAQQLVGNMYLNGTGVDRNETEAAKWFRLSAQQGNGAAMKAMGRLYVQARDVEQDLREAAHWFRRANAGVSTPQAAAEQAPDMGLRATSAQELVASCKQVQPEMPRLALQQNMGGTVVAQVLMTDGIAHDVVIVSGPKVFHESIRQALLQYDCSRQKYSTFASQEFEFVVDDGPRTKEIYRVAQLAPQFWTEPPPFNANWQGLSAEHKMVVRAQYANLSTDDEPPYPTDGMGELLENIRLTARYLGVEGNLHLNVKIDADGQVDSVNVLRTPNAELTQHAAAVAFRAKYKPALCAGKPCAGTLPIDIAITSYKPGTKSTGLETLRSAAEDGDPRAQNDLGERYEYGRGVSRDAAEAFKWYRESANQGFASGQNNLGRMYTTGRGVAKDVAEAAGWLRKSAEQNYAPAQLNYGYALADGRGVAADLPGSIQWFQKSAAQGYAAAQNSLGVAYANGQGVDKDLAKAVSLYEQAANKNDASAQLNLARAYALGRGTPQNIKLYAAWTRRSAESGNPDGQYGLGVAHTFGLGVPLDVNEAGKWFKKSANGGQRSGQDALGDAYQKGLGVPQDDAEALKWYRLAARRGSPSAMYNMYKMYADGRGVAKDLALATDWLQQAAKNGDEDAQFDLAKAYEAGIGVEKNAASAQQWHDKAQKSRQETIDGLQSVGMLKLLAEQCRASTIAAESDACKEVEKRLVPR